MLKHPLVQVITAMPIALMPAKLQLHFELRKYLFEIDSSLFPEIDSGFPDGNSV